MRWVIRHSAPPGRRGAHWGDGHFASSLALALKSLGHEAECEARGQWGSTGGADVCLVLRGLFPNDPGKFRLKILWIISHPKEVSKGELEGFDLVFCASHRHKSILDNLLHRKVEVLLQASETTIFKPCKNRLRGGGFVFVGNTRGQLRPAVLQAKRCLLPLRVWGRGWRLILEGGEVVASEVPYPELARIYGGAKVVLNDHWPDMKRLGYVSNRVFDALACGTPVISDYMPELKRMFPSAVLTFRNAREFETCIERVWFEYPNLLEA
ncbi:glycosyltransferase family 1 protein, partial [Candidatus Parcubacteria bacterium]